MNNKIDGNHFFLFHANHFLSSPEGQDVMNKALSKVPDIKDKVQKGIDMHNQILNKLGIQNENIPK